MSERGWPNTTEEWAAFHAERDREQARVAAKEAKALIERQYQESLKTNALIREQNRLLQEQIDSMRGAK